MTEFVIVVPVLLVLLLLSIEVSLLMAEKHLLTSAVYAAARMGVKTIQNSPPPGGEAPSSVHKEPLRDLAASDCPKPLLDAMHRKMAFKMAVVAPTMSSFLGRLGLPSLSPHTNSSLGRLGRIANGYVLGFLLSQVETCKVTPGGIAVTGRYLRHGRLPYAGNILWATYMLVHYVNRWFTRVGDGKPFLQANLDSHFFGLELTTPFTKETADRLKQKVQELIAKIKKLQDLNLGSEQIRGIFGDDLARLLQLDTYIGPIANAITAKLEMASGMIDVGLAFVEGQLHRHAQLATTVLYAIPEMLRVIPIRQTVFLAWEAQNIAGVNQEAWSGMNLLIAPYKNKAPGGRYELWETWVKHLVGYNSQWNTNREYLAAP